MRREGFAERLDHFEVLADRELMAGFPAVARLRVRDFDRLLPAVGEAGLAEPFDVGLGKAMVKTASHLLTSGTAAAYAFAERDEISVLLAPDDRSRGSGLTRAGVTRAPPTTESGPFGRPNGE